MHLLFHSLNWECCCRFSLYEPVEFINQFLKDKLEWNQVKNLLYFEMHQLTLQRKSLRPFIIGYARHGCSLAPD